MMKSSIECDKDQSLEDIASLMGIAPNWMPDSNLRANGYECSFLPEGLETKKRFTTQYMVMNRFILHNSCHEFFNNLN